MTLKRQLLTSKQTTIDIVSDDSLAESHFGNRSNFADVVLEQINTDRLYDVMFKDHNDMVILDIGGNIGLFTLYAQDSAKAIYPIEPTPNHFHILTELTKGYTNVHPLNLAVSDKNGTIDFYVNDQNTTMNSIENKYGTKIEVQTKTIRQIIDDLNLTHVDFIKCDIEGSEMVALTDETVGAVKDMVDTWFIEAHHTDTTRDENLATLTTVFTNQGYTVLPYREDGLYVYKEE